MTTLNFGAVEGLTETERQQLQDLAGVYNYHQSGNTVKNKYYEGHVTLNDVNLGIALPNGLRGMEIGCNWGQKAVDALADRSMFDGFVGSGAAAETMTQLVAGNRLLAEYAKACREELKYGCVFATLSADPALRCRIRFHSPATSAALWNGEKGRIDCGLAIIDTVPDEKFKGTWRPHIVNLYTDDAVLVLTAQNGVWTAERHAHRMGRPLMEPMIWNATSGKPFGRSRLKKAVRALIDDYIRIIANATIALEFDTTPQKYLLGLTDDQYDAVVSNKFKQYVGAILASTTNPETGENPQFGQLAQGSLQPHVDKMRMTATQFSAATGLTITDVGIINDANPTSSDAILAQSQTLVLMAPAAQHQQRRRAAHHRPNGTGHRPQRAAGPAERRRTRRYAALQKPGHAQCGGDGGRRHQDCLGPEGVRQHRHLPRNDRLQPGGHPPHQGPGTAGARAAAAR